MPRLSTFAALLLLVCAMGCGSSAPVAFDDTLPSYASSDAPVEHVVHISVDGLRSDAVTRYLDQLPAFARLRAQGAYTDNARTTPTRGNTIPNHTSQLTGRVVAGERGHGWGANRDTDREATLHSNKGGYVASVFDVAHDAGLRTGLYASKSKFALYERSYGAQAGRADTTGADDGRAKIDAYVYTTDTDLLTSMLVDTLQTDPYGYVLLHLRDPDTAGHRFGWRLWSWHPYMRAVRKADRLIGEVLAAIDADPDLRGRTAVVVTADHGGSGHMHGADDPDDYTVPFYVWGPGIDPGDLYELTGNRRDPGTDQIGADVRPQPIRNGDAANLALRLLGLPPVPGSTIGRDDPMPFGREAMAEEASTAETAF